MYNRKYTPDKITSLAENEIFVFGSNIEGTHGGGSARVAFNKFGAVWGEGVGLHGKSYAIPTMHGGLKDIKPYVDEFIRFAKLHGELTFLVVRLGCNYAGFYVYEIASLFKDAIDVENIILPKDFVESILNPPVIISDEITWNSGDFLSKYNTLIKCRTEDYEKMKGLRCIEYRNTKELVMQGFYITESGKRIDFADGNELLKNTVFYDGEFETNAPTIGTMSIEVVNGDCLEVGVRLKRNGYNPAILNMASRTTPGGYVTVGTGGQEETLFRRTDLYRSLCQFAPNAKQYGLPMSEYQYPLDDNFGGIYTPNATIFRESEEQGYKLMDEPIQLSFISVPGMNKPDIDSNGMIAQYHVEHIKNKMRTILRIGLRHGHDSLVLGALGCGAFCNPPSHIAHLFHEVFEEPEFKNKYRIVSFAILDDHNAHKSHNLEGNYKPFVDEFINNTSSIEFIVNDGCLLKINNPQPEVWIPEGVVSLGPDVFNSDKISEIIHFPSSLVSYTYRSLIFRHQHTIIVDENNPVFSSYDGVLYDKKLTALICCPMAKKGVHRMPTTCRTIGAGAFCCSELDELIINNSLTTIEESAFADCFIKAWPIIPRSVVSIEGNPFEGEYSYQDIRVYKDSFVHHFAKKHKVRYRCVPEHGETVWSEHEWIESFNRSRFRNDEEEMDKLRNEVYFNNYSIYHGQKYMTAHGHCVDVHFDPNVNESKRVYEDLLPKTSCMPAYETEIRISPVDAITLARKLKQIDGNVCLLGMVNESHDQCEQLWLRTDYAKWCFQYKPCFLPHMTAFRDSEKEGYRLLKHPWHFNLITIPVTTDLEELCNLFRIAIDNNQETLVVDPFLETMPFSAAHYSGLFKMILEKEFKQCFKRVYFALPNEKYDDSTYHMYELEFTENQYAKTFEVVRSLRKECTTKANRIHSSKFYENLIWSLYSDGTLEISGTGRMPDYINHWDSYIGEGQAPWIGCEKYGVLPYKLRICDGITYVGANAFESFGCLQEVELADSVRELGKMAFFDCFHIVKINIPSRMDLKQFDVAELPLYYNGQYDVKDYMLVAKNHDR